MSSIYQELILEDYKCKHPCGFGIHNHIPFIYRKDLTLCEMCHKELTEDLR